MKSQNGWPVIESTTATTGPRLRKWIIPGTGRHLYARDGSAGFLLALFALWFHEVIERLDGGIWDEWGWAFRPIRGGLETSNHASGTAVDLNATQHPLGARGTFRRLRDAARIRLRLAFMRDVIRWGGDFTGRADEMHFEIDRPLARCENVAQRLTGTPRGRRILAANPGAKEVIYS
jgi:hypothetical protein